MGVIGVILLVAFVIICILLICLVLVQNEDGAGLGGLFGGASSTAFGSRSGNVLTKTTYVLVALFFLASFGLAFMNKAPTVELSSDASDTVESSEGFWLEEDTSAAEDTAVTE